MNLLTLNEVAVALKVSESTVRRWIRSGSLIAYKVGQRGQLRIREDELERFLETQLVQVDNKGADEHGMGAQNGENVK